MKSLNFNTRAGNQITTAIKDYETYYEMVDRNLIQLTLPFVDIFDYVTRDFNTNNMASKMS